MHNLLPRRQLCCISPSTWRVSDSMCCFSSSSQVPSHVVSACNLISEEWRIRMQHPLKGNISFLHFSHPWWATVHIQEFQRCKTLPSRPYWLLKISEARQRENLRVHLSPVPIGGGVEVHTARRAPLLPPIPFWICPFWHNVSITYNSVLRQALIY